MIIPIRCFTCNNVVGHLWEEYNDKVQKYYSDNEGNSFRKERFVEIQKLKNGKTFEGQILDEMGIHKYCCRRMLECHVDLTDKI